MSREALSLPTVTMHKRTLLAILLSLAGGSAVAAELKVYPPEVTISGPNRMQQLVVVEEDGGRVVADRTAAAKFATSAEKVAKVAKVAAAGNVTAAGNGEATITATINGKNATAKVRVSGMGQPAGWSFRNHVIPTFTKIGCNSGACHGALAGKGGMKLSLRGYDPEAELQQIGRAHV